MAFEQAVIKVERESEFEELKNAISHAFASEKAETFLRRLKKQSLRVRNWDAVLANGMLEKVDEGLAKPGKTAYELYRQLTVSDQAQIREFYLSQVEEVDPNLRTRFHKIYQYY